MALPVKLLMKFLGNCVLVWALTTFLPDYVFITGGLQGLLMVGAILTLLNLTLRPLLNLVTFPLKLVATIAAAIVANSIFLFVTREILFTVDPDIVVFEILGGVWGWICVSLLIGAGNWGLKHFLP